jgi:DNA-binding PadR family transcriptional regulator
MKERQPFTSHLSPDYLLLGLLAISPSHGYELHQQIERDLRYVWRLSLSQVYNVLARLEKRGMIQGEIMEQDERPDRKRFWLTPEGERHFKIWFQKPVGASVHAVRIAFLSKLYFAGQMTGIDYKALWDEQIDTIVAGRSRLESRLTETADAHPILEHSLRLRIMQLDALLEWLEEYQQDWIATQT